MVSLEEAVVARMDRKGMHFEIMVDPEKALELRRGKEAPLEEILAVRDVFTDAGKGERAAEEDLEKAFQTTDSLRIAREIVLNGDVQITTEQRRRLTEERRRQVADMISRQGVDPKTNLPHPPQRVLNAMEEAHVHVDPFRRARDQLEEVLGKVREVIPVSMERVEVELRVPMQFAGKASSAIREMTPVKKEEWRPDSWVAVIEIPAGMQSDVYGKLNELTSGRAETRVLRKGP